MMFETPFDTDDDDSLSSVNKAQSWQTRREMLSETLFSIALPVKSAEQLFSLFEGVGYPLNFEITEKLVDAARTNQFPDFDAIELLYTHDAPIEIRCQHRFETNNTPYQTRAETHLYSRSSSEPLPGIRLLSSLDPHSVQVTVELASLIPEDRMLLVEDLIYLFDYKPISESFAEYSLPAAIATESPSILTTQIYPNVFLSTFALHYQHSFDDDPAPVLGAASDGVTPRAFLLRSPEPKILSDLLKLWNAPELTALAEMNIFGLVRSFVTAHQPLSHDHLLCALKRAGTSSAHAIQTGAVLTATRSVRLGCAGDGEEQREPCEYEGSLEDGEWGAAKLPLQGCGSSQWHEQAEEDEDSTEEVEIGAERESYLEGRAVHPLDAHWLTSSISIESSGEGMHGCSLLFQSHAYPRTLVDQLGDDAQLDRPAVGVYLPLSPVPGRYPTIQSHWQLFRKIAKTLEASLPSEVSLPVDRVRREVAVFLNHNPQVRTVDYCSGRVIVRIEAE